MEVWKLAKEIVKDVYTLSDKLPRAEDYTLTSQARRTSLSIAANIAKGFGRGHKKDKVRFCLVSRESTYEVRSHLLMGAAVGYFSEDEIERINIKCKKVVLELNKIIKTLSHT